MTKATIEAVEPILYSRTDVFAAACAAQRINGEYVKRTDAGRYVNTGYGLSNPKAISTAVESNATKLYNSALMKALLASDRSDILPEDYERGEAVRSHFCSMIVSVFEGTARDFIKDAVAASIAEEIPNAGKMFGIVASLPSITDRNIVRASEREALDKLISQSTPIDGNLEDTVKFNVTVVDSVFKPRFGSSAVNVKVNNVPGNHILFFFNQQETWTKGCTYNISGRIKNKGNQVTQLHYVKKRDPSVKEKVI